MHGCARNVAASRILILGVVFALVVRSLLVLALVFHGNATSSHTRTNQHALSSRLLQLDFRTYVLSIARGYLGGRPTFCRMAFGFT